MKDYIRDTISSEKGFWVGDPSWVLPELPPLVDGINILKDISFVDAKTNQVGTFKWGGRSYAVKSGHLALIPLELCDPEMLEQNAAYGKVWHKPGKATMYSHFGYFEFLLPDTPAIIELYTGQYN